MFAASSRSAIAVQTVGQLLLPLCAACVIAVLSVPALAHDAKPTAAKPQGWSYPFACCANYDCHEVSQTSISERPEGYVIKDTGEVLAYSDRRIKDSRRRIPLVRARGRARCRQDHLPVRAATVLSGSD